MIHQQADPGVEGGFGELDRAHVVLGDAQLACGAVVQHVRERAVVGHARERCGGRTVDGCPSRRITPARKGSAMLRYLPRAANTRDADISGLLRRLGLVRPRVDTDDLDARFECVAVDPHPFDGAGRRALAARQLCPFERGAGGARRREQPVAVAQHDLRVGADVDEVT